jgi:hypothetical protein
MSDRQKYLKYKKKYLELKKHLRVKQYGGARFSVIPNSGAEDGMTNQCMWISIRDYLKHYLGIKITVKGVRKMAGLDATTEQQMFDWEIPKFRQALERIAHKFNLQLQFYSVDHDGNPDAVLYFDPETKQFPMPMHTVNEHGLRLVNIAFYGAHFQLITGGNNVHVPRRLSKEIIHSKPITTITFSGNQVVEGELKKYLDAIIDANQSIQVYEKEIEKLRNDIANIKRNLDTSKSSDVFTDIKSISEREIAQINTEIKVYEDIIVQARKTIEVNQSEIDKKLTN